MTDINQIAAALEGKDYKQAAQLIKQLQKESPENPWVQYYIGPLLRTHQQPRKSPNNLQTNTPRHHQPQNSLPDPPRYSTD